MHSTTTSNPPRRELDLIEDAAVVVRYELESEGLARCRHAGVAPHICVGDVEYAVQRREAALLQLGARAPHDGVHGPDAVAVNATVAVVVVAAAAAAAVAVVVVVVVAVVVVVVVGGGGGAVVVVVGGGDVVAVAVAVAVVVGVVVGVVVVVCMLFVVVV